jgi:flagellar biogenesis protein FliO
MPISQYIQTIVTLVFFAGILVGLLWLSKFFQKKKYAGNIKVVDRLAIDHGVSLVIVEIREEEYLMSVGGKELRLLSKIK